MDITQCLLSTVYFCFVDFAINNVTHNSPESHEVQHYNKIFSIFLGLRDVKENMFHGFGSWVIRQWKSVGSMLRE